MNHLPTEVLREIFINLSLKDKLKCMRVCHQWYDVLDRHSVLHTLDCISIYKFFKLKKMIARKPYRASQVENLTLSSNSRSDFDKRILCNMFPNLREIILHTSSYGFDETNYLDNPFQFMHPTSKLEKIVDSGQCELTCQLAMSSRCNKLKSLELTFTSKCNLNLSRLQNMPILETLKLHGFKAKLMDLEMIHRNLPSIKRLYLRDVGIISGEIPHDIIPASLVTEFGLSLSDRFNVLSSALQDVSIPIQFYKYFAKKYPSVKKPALDHGMQSYRFTNDIRAIYNEGILPLYRNIGPYVDTFSFDRYCDGLDAFRKFDEFGMKLKELTLQSEYDDIPFIEELVPSQQSKSIQELILKEIVPDPLEMMSNMEALTTLTIDCSNGFALSQEQGSDDESHMCTIDFNQLIAACPEQLTHLIIKGVILTFDKPTTNLTPIQYLKLVNVKIHLAATITGTNFPKLTTLYLETLVTANLTVSLPKNHIKKVAIYIKYPEDEECGISVKVMNKGEPHCNVIWPTSERGTRGFLYGSDKLTSKSAAKNMVEFICASVGQLSYSIVQEEGRRYDEDGDY